MALDLKILSLAETWGSASVYTGCEWFCIVVGYRCKVDWKAEWLDVT